jgi:hypothetical protein
LPSHRISYSEIKAKFDALAAWNSRPTGFELFMPQLCGEFCATACPSLA